MILVVDASVIVKWFFRDPATEEHAEHALLVLQSVRAGAVEILQPPHWLAEVAAVIARLEPGVADEAIDVLDAMEFPIAADAAVYKRATSLAGVLRQHVFDTLYHAVALEHRAELISADRRYYLAAKQLGRITYLANWDRLQQGVSRWTTDSPGVPSGRAAPDVAGRSYPRRWQRTTAQRRSPVAAGS